MGLLGAAELKADFHAVRTASNNSLRNAAAAGGRIVRDSARALAPQVTGHGAKRIQMQRGRGRIGEGVAYVGVLRPAFYLLFFETGTKGHEITARSASLKVKNEPSKGKTPRKVRVLVTKGGKFLGKTVTVRGMPRTPFLTAALASTQDQVVSAMQQVLDDALVKRGKG